MDNMNVSSNLSSICFANITLNKFAEKNIIWFERLMYVYILGPFLVLGILGNIFYFIISLKMKYGKNTLRDNKDGRSLPVNRNADRLGGNDIRVQKF
ncbi:unnamed protein product [Gordionus sp. m RMFG-2023]